MNTSNPSNPSNPSGSQQNKGFGSTPSQSNPNNPTAGRQDPNQRQASSSQASGPQDSASRSFKSGSESESTLGQDSGRGGKQDVERYLNAIEENCRELRQALGSSSSNDSSRSDISDTSRTQTGRDSGRDAGRDAGRSSTTR